MVQPLVKLAQWLGQILVAELKAVRSEFRRDVILVTGERRAEAGEAVMRHAARDAAGRHGENCGFLLT